MDNMNRSSDIVNTLPSGYEVESAVIVDPTPSAGIDLPRSAPQSMKEKVTDKVMHEWMPRASETMHDVQSLAQTKLHDAQTKLHDVQLVAEQKVSELKSTARERMESWRTMATTRVASVRNDLSMRVTRMQGDMRVNPAKWAGIAAGAGVGVGLLGRWMRYRSKYHHPTQQLVIIEAAC